MDIIEKNHMRFDECISHTEDGLFVFDYLESARDSITSRFPFGTS